uniref:Uncharacterized protein n=1 Tax=Arundo donax TaxID=35708 RepID=A0A0A9F6R8_ARUDO
MFHLGIKLDMDCGRKVL